jgi:hypothetical protein
MCVYMGQLNSCSYDVPMFREFKSHYPHHSLIREKEMGIKGYVIACAIASLLVAVIATSNLLTMQ